jgi:hypothetical protein
MVNQVTFEGYLVRAWIHGAYLYLRLANHRPPQMGGQCGGPLPVESDYVTARLDPSVNFDMQRATPGLHIILRGRIEGRDIPETIGDILQHCHLNIPLTQDIARLQVTRPAVQIYCTTLEFRGNKLGSGKLKRDRKHGGRRAQDQPCPREVNTAGQPSPLAIRPDQEPPDGAVPHVVQPGQDIAELVSNVETRKTCRASTEKTTEARVKKNAPVKASKNAADKTVKKVLVKTKEKIPAKEVKRKKKD